MRIHLDTTNPEDMERLRVALTADTAEQALAALTPIECPRLAGAIVTCGNRVFVRTAAHNVDCNDWVELDTGVSGGVTMTESSAGTRMAERHHWQDLPVPLVLRFEGVPS